MKTGNNGIIKNVVAGLLTLLVCCGAFSGKAFGTEQFCETSFMARDGWLEYINALDCHGDILYLAAEDREQTYSAESLDRLYFCHI